MKNKLLILFFGIVVNVHTYSQWADITSTIGGGITSTTNMAKPYVFDINNDNYPDFLVPVLTNVVSPYTKYWKLFKNNGNSTFTDVTTSYGLSTNLTSTLGFIDYNGDGFKDLYFYTATGLQILKNNNGTSFTDVSTQLGIASTFFISGEITSYPLKVFDYDLDGDEDLLYTRTVSGSNTLTAIVNNGTSFSTKVNIINSIPGATTGGINFSLFDMDNDGDFDIVFDAFSGTSQYSNGITTLYRKDATSYTNTTSTSGLANGLPGDISTIDINQDGNLDIVKGGADCCTSPLYRVFIGNGTGVFTEQTSTYSISNGGYKYNGTLTDFDNDTDFDFSWSNYTGTGAAPFRLYVNNGSNVFTENASTYGLSLGVTSGGVPIDDYGNGVWMDLDKDGDLDIILNREGSGSTSTTGNIWVKRNPLQGNYINIKLNGCGVNKSGVGAKIKLVVGTNTKWLYYEKSPDGNITNGTDTFHFGLGSATLINSITVYWPNNTTTVLNNVSGNQFLTIGGGAGGSSAPTGSASQTLCSGSTVANLTATGTNIKWYSTSTGGTALASTTALVNGTTYYASQTVNSCESTTRLGVTVVLNGPYIPLFNQIPPICFGEPLPPLFTTSTNGIVGSWFPVLNNTATTTYFFTPEFGQCATSTNMSITVNPLPDAGEDSNSAICSNFAPVDLRNYLAGTPQAGGIWTPSLASGTGFFDPAVDLSGTYTYTVNGVAPCANDTSVATITIVYQPDAGLDGSVTVCDSSLSTIDLNTLITGEQSGGTWSRTSGTGGTFNSLVGTFTPSAGGTSSTFEYRIMGMALCVDDFSTATVNINAQPNAGLDGSTAVCESSAPIDLFSLITGEQTGGVWIRTSGLGGTFNPLAGTFTPSAGATSSTFDYRITYAAPCVDFSTATVNIIYSFLTPNFSPISPFCAGGTAPLLPPISPNGITGTWLPVTVDNISDGTYYFTPFAGQCATDTALSVTVISLPPSPIGANNQTIAQGSTLANLLVTGQDIQWYASPFGGTPLPLNTPLVNGTTYYASQTINGCESQNTFPVVVQVTLSNNEFGSIGIVYSPNPVIDIITVKASAELKNAKICNVLGQIIFQQRFNSNDIQLNMSDVPSGTYFVIVEADNRKETFKVLKN